MTRATRFAESKLQDSGEPKQQAATFKEINYKADFTEDQDEDYPLGAADDPANWWVFDNPEELGARYERYVQQLSPSQQRKIKLKATKSVLARPSGYSYSACGQFLDVLDPVLSKSASQGSLLPDANKKQSAAALMQKRIRESKLPSTEQFQQRAKEKLARIRFENLKVEPLPDALAWKSPGPQVSYGPGPALPPPIAVSATTSISSVKSSLASRSIASGSISLQPNSAFVLRQSAHARVIAKISAKRQVRNGGHTLEAGHVNPASEDSSNPQGARNSVSKTGPSTNSPSDETTEDIASLLDQAIGEDDESKSSEISSKEQKEKEITE